MTGLSACDGFSQTSCSTKLTEAITSFLVLILTIHQIIMNIKAQGQLTPNFFFFIELFMSLSLIFNITHDIWGSQNPLLYLEIMFGNAYFLTIIYFIGYNTFTKQVYRKILSVTYAVFLLFYVAITIERSVQNPGNSYYCTQTWFLVIDSFAISLSLFLFVTYRMKENSENQINQEYYKYILTNSQIKSPFKRMWILIGANIFCSVVSFGRTVSLLIINPNTCSFSSNPSTQAIIDLLFAYFSYYLGFIVTLIIFMLRRKDLNALVLEEKQKKSRTISNDTEIRGTNRLQMIDRQSFVSSDSPRFGW